MQTPFPFYEVLAWAIGPLLALVILAIGHLRGSLRELRFFAAYLVFFLFREMSYFWLSHSHLAASRGVYDYYWITEFVLATLRLLTIGEIYWRSLGNYPAVWDLTWRVLSGLAAALLLWSAYSAAQHTAKIAKFFYNGLQYFEFMQAALLVASLAVIVCYHVQLLPLHKLMLIGLCVYSLVQVMTYAMASRHPGAMHYWFSLIRQISYGAAIFLWVYAFARPVQTRAPAPTLISRAEYDDLSVQFDYRMKVLNNRLLTMLRS